MGYIYKLNLNENQKVFSINLSYVQDMYIIIC